MEESLLSEKQKKEHFLWAFRRIVLFAVVRRGNRGFFPYAAGSKRRQEHEQSRLGRKETVGTFRKRPVSFRGDRSGFRRDAGSPHLGRSRVARVARRQNAGADHAGRPDG